jgi:hypothetical protein
MLALAAERAVQSIFGVSATANFRHFGSPGTFTDRTKSMTIIRLRRSFLDIYATYSFVTAKQTP